MKWYVEYTEYTGDAVLIHDENGTVIKRGPFSSEREANTQNAIAIVKEHNEAL